MLDEVKREEGLRHFQRGLALERVNRVAEAVEQYHRAIACDPNLGEAYMALGLHYQQGGLLAKAAESFRAVAHLEDSFLAWFHLGIVLIAIERFDEAQQAFEHCLRLESADPASHFELGRVFMARNEYQAALAHLQIPLELYPDDPDLHLLIGRCLLEVHRFDDAEAVFGNVLGMAQEQRTLAEAELALQAVARYREFKHLHSLKDRLYAQLGVICLGSAQDNGLDIHETAVYHLTYPDIAITLKRFQALVAKLQWQFSAIIPGDLLSEPVAQALSTLIQTPFKQLDQTSESDRVLVVFGVMHQPESLQVLREHATCPTLSFSLSSDWRRSNKTIAEINGVIATSASSVPWEPALNLLRSEHADPDQLRFCLDTATQSIEDALDQIGDESSLTNQIRYYSRDHRQLAFPFDPAEKA